MEDIIFFHRCGYCDSGTTPEDIDYEFLREIQQYRNSFCVLTFLHISTAFLDLLTRLTI